MCVGWISTRGITLWSSASLTGKRRCAWRRPGRGSVSDSGGYENAYSEYRLVNWPESLGHAHNFYLNMLAETGVFGLAAYLALCVALLWRSWRARAHPDSLARYLAIGVFAAWVYFCVHSLSDNLYVNNSFLILGTMLGLMLHIYSQIQPRRLT